MKLVWHMIGISIAALLLSSCVVMTRRNYYLIQYENRLLGRMEGISDCGEIAFKKLDQTEPDSFEGLSDKAAKEVDRHFRKTEERLGVR